MNGGDEDRAAHELNSNRNLRRKKSAHSCSNFIIVRMWPRLDVASLSGIVEPPSIVHLYGLLNVIVKRVP